MYTEMVLFFWEHQSYPLKNFCIEEGLEYKCYQSLHRVIMMNPILDCLMRNQPDSGFTKLMSLDALKEIPPSFQTEESLHHDIKQLYHRLKQNENNQEHLSQMLITNTFFVQKFCDLTSFDNNAVVICDDGTFIRRCHGCCNTLCSKIVICGIGSTTRSVCRRCYQIEKNTTRLEKTRVTNWDKQIAHDSKTRWIH